MGLAHVKAALVVPNLTPRESKILVYLACCYSDTKYCWPALKTVSEGTNIAYIEVVRIINILEKKKCIIRFVEGRLKKIKLLGCHSDNTKLSEYQFNVVNLTTPIYKEVRKKRKKEESHGASTIKPSNINNPFLEDSLRRTFQEESKKTNINKYGEYIDYDEEEENMKNPYMGKTIEEIANAQSPRHKLGQLKKVTPRTMETMWYEVCAEVYEDKFTPSFTMKEKGMMGHFIKRATPVHAEAAMFYVLHNWNEFTNYCVSQGAKAHPSEPTIQYMLLYVRQAVNFAFKFVECSESVLEVQDYEDEVIPPRKKPRELAPEDQPMTLEEFQKFRAEEAKARAKDEG